MPDQPEPTAPDLPGCLFCPGSQGNTVIASAKTAYVRLDNFPAAAGHMEVVPRRHVESFFDLSSEEVQDVYDLACQARESVPDADGWTVGVNEGRAAGRTVDHVHVHLIPRRLGDVPDPTGGVRWVLPDTAALPRTGVQPDTRPESTRAELIRDSVTEWQKDCVWIDVNGSPMVLADSWPDAPSLIDAIHTAAGLDGTEDTEPARRERWDAESSDWYEVINPRNATTYIALVYEDGSLYLPEGEDLTEEEFHFAAARGTAYRLIRMDAAMAVADEEQRDLRADRDNLRVMYDVSEARVHDLIEERDEREAQATLDALAELGQARATTLVEAADALREMHYMQGMSVQEIGTALRHMASDAAAPGGQAEDGAQQK